MVLEIKHTKKLKTILQSKNTYLILIIICFLFVFIRTRVIKYESKINVTNVIEGVVKDVDVKENGVSFIVLSDELVKCNYYGKDFQDYYYILGKKIKVTGEVKELKNNTVFNAFNYKKYLYNNHIYLNYNVNKIEILEDENIFYKLKNSIIKRINNISDNDSSVQAYFNLFVLGNNDYLDNNIYASYKENGIWHLFAVSGMHISLIVLCLEFLLKKVKFKNIIVSIFLLYFLFLTNYSASVLRCVLFYLFNLILKNIDKDISSIKVLIIVAFIILVFDPFMIYNVGFLYSFLISFSIMFLSKKITGNYFMKIFKISLLSFFVSLPITASLNYEVNITSIFLNIFYVPFISFIVFPVTIVSFFMPFLIPILKILIIILEKSNLYFNSFSLIKNIPKLNILIIFIYYLILILAYKNKKFLILAVVLIYINDLIYLMDSNCYVYYFDVSQGDSSLLITPYKKEVILIDTGGIVNFNNSNSYKPSDSVIMFLKSRGITKINSIIISHGDYDHMGDINNYLDNFKISNVIFNCGNYNELESNLIKSLKKNKIKYYSCINNLNKKDYELKFLNTKIYNNENNDSSVLYFKYSKYKFLFMGDAGVIREKEIINNYNIRNIDFLKVGHHGSDTSSSKDFIDIMNPKYSIISVGENNRYNHPKKSVLNTLSNSKIYRTDKDGSIEIKIKSAGYSIDTCSS